ncbi:MAG: hypothetical protein EAZ36_02660, partial [Verrucomicrobia bacterium]
MTAHPPSPLRQALLAARANIVPGLVLQVAAGAILAGYTFHGPTRVALEQISAFRTEVGVAFALVSTAVFGAILPFLVLSLSKHTRHRYTLRQMGALTAFWAYKGAEVSGFYALQALAFGEGTDVATIAIKTVVDQFVYGPLLAAPFTWLFYLWVEHHFDRSAVAAELRQPGVYARGILPLLVASWGVWLPTVILIYLLPTPLQLPMQNIVCCFYTLMLIFMTRRPASTPPRASERF